MTDEELFDARAQAFGRSAMDLAAGLVVAKGVMGAILAYPLIAHAMLNAAVHHPEWAAWWVAAMSEEAADDKRDADSVVRMFPIEARDE